MSGSCAADLYQDQTGQTSCKSCTTGSSTNGLTGSDGAGDAAEWVISATAWTPDMAHEEAQVLFERLKKLQVYYKYNITSI